MKLSDILDDLIKRAAGQRASPEPQADRPNRAACDQTLLLGSGMHGGQW